MWSQGMIAFSCIAIQTIYNNFINENNFTKTQDRNFTALVI